MATFRIVYRYGWEDVKAPTITAARKKAEPTVITGPVLHVKRIK